MTTTIHAASKLATLLQNIYKSQKQGPHPELSVHGYVLRRGRLFQSQPLTPQEQAYIDLENWKRHKQRECYQNAQLTALALPLQEDMDLRYAEGFVYIGKGIAIHHAWISLNSKVVDTTIRIHHRAPRLFHLRPMGTLPEGWEYYGVEFDPIKHLLYILDIGHTKPLLNDWRNNWPIIRGDPA